jgi:hypothetical protein
MALTKERVLDKIEIVQDVLMQVRYRDLILENGNEVAHTFFREVIDPSTDVSGKPQTVQSIAAVLYTPEVKAAYAAKLALLLNN